MKKNPKSIRWLYDELPEWVGEGIVTEESAGRLRERYGPPESGGGRRIFLIICAIFGSVLIGLGIILMFAHNWDQLTRPMRAALSFAPQILGLGLVAYAILRRGESVAWREGSATFLMIATGACIALIGQTYHVTDDLEGFLFIWMLLSAPLVYLAGASLPAALYMVGLLFWAGNAQPGWRWETGGKAYLCWPLLALMIPHIWQAARRDRYGARASLLGWVLAACLCIAPVIVHHEFAFHLWIVFYASLFVCMYLLGGQWFGEAPTIWQKPLQTVGSCGAAVFALVLTFKDVWRELSWRDDYRTLDFWNRNGWALTCDLGLTCAVFAAAVALFVMSLRRKGANRQESILASFVIVAALGYSLGWLHPSLGVWVALLMNLWLFATGVATIVLGVRRGSLLVVNGGLAMVSMLIVARFFDTDWSFVIRGIVFIILGIGFLTVNLIISKRKEKTA
ncbi:MAG: DUF2157 domain-containing protein [Candidatus Sumerlaeota bacterium]|nr:DUF2157 domain-containing protein [Candidatus Sumerlaeota bacterium]